MAELPERLREAAGEHRPDRERMLARVEHAMISPGRGAAVSAGDRPAAPWMRVTAVTAAAVGLIGIGSLTVGAVSNDREPGQSAVTSSGSGSTASQAPPAQAVSPEPSTGHRNPGRPGHHKGDASPGSAGPTVHPSTASAAPQEPASASASAPAPAEGTVSPPAGGSSGGTGVEGDLPPFPQPPFPAPPQAPLPRPSERGGSGGATSACSATSDSTGQSTQSTITLTIRRPLTSLTVELRVAGTPEVASTGAFSSAAGQTAVAVDDEGGFLVYRWTLTPGQTLQAGTYTFTGQFSHPAGRGPGGDAYAVTGSKAGGPVTSGGGFRTV